MKSHSKLFNPKKGKYEHLYIVTIKMVTINILTLLPKNGNNEHPHDLIIQIICLYYLLLINSPFLMMTFVLHDTLGRT